MTSRPSNHASSQYKPLDTAAAHAMLERSVWFQGAPGPLRDALRTQGRVQALGAGEFLFMRGEAYDGLYCVLEGAIRLGAVSAEGRETLLAVISVGHWFGEIALFDRGVRTHDAYAVRNSTLFHVPAAALDALLDAEPSYWQVFGLLMTHKLRLAFDAIEESALLPAPARVARRLLLLADEYGEAARLNDAASRSRVINTPQEDLALMLALSRQTVNQILRQFEREGLLALRYGEIEIVDPQRLGTQARPL